MSPLTRSFTMNTLSRTARLIAAFTAVAITLTLLGTVFAIAEPQRSVLIAKLERADHPVATTIAVALATTAGAKLTK
jgi:hypothetical protein